MGDDLEKDFDDPPQVLRRGMFRSSRARIWTVFIAVVPLTLAWSYAWHRIIDDYTSRADLIGGAIEVVVVVAIGVPWIMLAYDRETK